MRITKLHLLLFILLVGGGIYASYFWQEKQAREARESQNKAMEESLAQKRFDEEQMRKSQTAPAPPPAAPAPLPQVSEPPQPKKEEPEAVNYVVKRGDTLWKIAKMGEHFGEGHRWYDIWKANEDKVEDFDHLVSGQSLLIPLDKPENYNWPKTSEEEKMKILGRPGRSPKPASTN